MAVTRTLAYGDDRREGIVSKGTAQMAADGRRKKLKKLKGTFRYQSEVTSTLRIADDLCPRQEHNVRRSLAYFSQG